MITHTNGADQTIAYDWFDTNCDLILPDGATFDVDDGETSLVSWTLSDAGLSTATTDTVPHSLILSLPDDLALDAGLYAFRLTATSGTFTKILGDGPFRVR